MLKIIKNILFSCTLLFVTSVSLAEDANYYLKKASKAYNLEKYPEAEEAFQKVLEMEVSLHSDFYYYYGKTLYHNGHYDKAIKNLTYFTKKVGNKSRYYSSAKRLLSRSEKNIAKQQASIKEKNVEKPKESRKRKNINKLPNVPEMIKIPLDSFIMGSNHGGEDQRPPHRIKMKNEFAIGKYEVTFSQYDAFAKATKQKMPDDLGWGRGNRPVINVSLQNAKNYALWLSKKTNRKFRLPTETEWEYVARTGFKSKLGFNDIMGLGDANCDGCRYFWESAKTIEVGSFEANKYGVYDLFGNVWEWTCSVYTKGYRGEEKYCADKNDLNGKTVAVRGGGWNSYSATLRSYVRYNNFPNYLGKDLGFRLVEELD